MDENTEKGRKKAGRKAPKKSASAKRPAGKTVARKAGSGKKKLTAKAQKKGGSPLEAIGYATGKAVGRISRLAGKTSGAIHTAAEKILESAKKRGRRG